MDIDKFGWNLFTFFSLGNIFFAFVSAWGLWQQSQKIRQNKSADSVSLFWFSYNIFLFSSGVIYGWAIKSVVMMSTSSFLALMHIPLLISLAKYKGFNEIQRSFFFLYFALLILMATVAQKELLYLVFSFVNIAAMATQPWEIFKKKNAGTVEIRLQIIYFFSSCFWLAYAIMMKAWVLEIIIPIYLCLLALTVVLWKKYQVKPASGSS